MGVIGTPESAVAESSTRQIESLLSRRREEEEMARSTSLILSQSHLVQMQYPIPNHEAQLLCHSRCHHRYISE